MYLSLGNFQIDAFKYFRAFTLACKFLMTRLMMMKES